MENFTVGMVKNDSRPFGCPAEVITELHAPSIVPSNHFGLESNTDMNTSSALKKEPLDRDEIKKFIADMVPSDSCEIGSPGEVSSVVHPTSIIPPSHFGLKYNSDVKDVDPNDNSEFGSPVEVNSDVCPTSIIPTNHFGLAGVKDMDPNDNWEISSPGEVNSEVHPTSIIPTSQFGLKYNADATEMGTNDNCEFGSPVEVNSDVHPTSIIPTSHFGRECYADVKDVDPNDNSEFGSPGEVNCDVRPTSIIPTSHFGLQYNSDATERGTNDKCELGALVDVRMELQESSISIPLSILTQSEIQQNLSVDNSIIKRQKARELKAIQMQSVTVTRPPNLLPRGKAQSEESVSCSQTEQGKSSMRVRQSYTAERKLEIVEYALTHTVKEAADKFHVNVGTVRMWRSKQDCLRKMPKDKKANRGPNAPGIEKFKKVHHLSFSAGDKLKVVQYATTHGICAAGREYCISMVKVRNWIKQKDELMKMPHKNIANCTEPVSVPSAMQEVFKRNTPCKEKGEGQRLAYTAGEKLQIVHYGLAYGQKAAAEKFNVSLSNIKAWRKMTNFLKKMPSDKMANRGNMPQFPSLEEALLNWINEKRQDGVLVSVDDIQERALSLSVGVSGMEDFTASYSWCQSFLRRNNQNQYFKSREKIFLFHYGKINVNNPNN